MTIVITMAGLGSRFKDSGYVVPKFQISARGRSLMEWSLLSMNAFYGDTFIFACLDSENEEWILSLARTLGISKAVVTKRTRVSRGQAETAFDALGHADQSKSLWIYNIDTHVAPSVMRPENLASEAGCVPVFFCTEPNMSFVRHAEGDSILEIAEKRPISAWATVGLYGFRSAAYFADLYIDGYDRGKLRGTIEERYVAPLYELALLRGDRVLAPRLRMNDVHILGTPSQLLSFDPGAAPPFGNAAGR